MQETCKNTRGMELSLPESDKSFCTFAAMDLKETRCSVEIECRGETGNVIQSCKLDAPKSSMKYSNSQARLWAIPITPVSNFHSSSNKQQLSPSAEWERKESVSYWRREDQRSRKQTESEEAAVEQVERNLALDNGGFSSLAAPKHFFSIPLSFNFYFACLLFGEIAKTLCTIAKRK